MSKHIRIIQGVKNVKSYPHHTVANFEIMCSLEAKILAGDNVEHHSMLLERFRKERIDVFVWVPIVQQVEIV